jgi:hypothetical protein
VVVVVGAVVVDVVDRVVVDVVGPPPVVVVVLAGAVSVPKRMSEVPLSPASSPYIRVHTSPAACWAVVGGHGYRAASAAALLPALSVGQVVMMTVEVPHGGPTVPPMTL